MALVKVPVIVLDSCPDIKHPAHVEVDEELLAAVNRSALQTAANMFSVSQLPETAERVNEDMFATPVLQRPTTAKEVKAL